MWVLLEQREIYIFTKEDMVEPRHENKTTDNLTQDLIYRPPFKDL
jgi:hypothetical protein